MTRLIPFLLALGCAIPATATTFRTRAGNYELQVLVNGSPVRSFSRNGDTWLLGTLGERYTLRVLNRSPRPIEAVVSVDGRDVIDGDTASAQKGGYLVPAYGRVDIDGWRISHAQAAAFRFSSVQGSYAAQMGSGREVGVIGVAIYQEKVRPPPPPPVAVIVPRDVPYPESCCAARGMNQPAPHDDSIRAEEHADGAPVPRSAPAPMQTAPKSMSGGTAEKDSVASAPPPATAYRGASASNGAAVERQQSLDKKKERGGLGTEYGEAVSSYIHEVSFERATANPAVILGAHYNDRDGLIAMGFELDGSGEQSLRQTANPFPGVERSYAQPPPNWNR